MKNNIINLSSIDTTVACFGIIGICFCYYTTLNFLANNRPIEIKCRSFSLIMPSIVA